MRGVNVHTHKPFGGKTPAHFSSEMDRPVLNREKLGFRSEVSTAGESSGLGPERSGREAGT